MAFPFYLTVVVLACIDSSLASTCSDFPVRLPGKILEVSSSDSSTFTCPSEAEREATLDMLNRDLNSIIADQISVIERLTYPIECPGGGWVKVADFNLETDYSAVCPGEWIKEDINGVAHCQLNAISSPSSLCQLATFSTNSISYSQVCGRVKGYQIGRTTGFFLSASDASLPLSSAYLDGVSITYDSQRGHVWSFGSGTASTNSGLINTLHLCPCLSEATASEINLPSYIGNNYFCDSGSYNQSTLREFYHEDPLWDGAGCMPGNGCCERGPYFVSNLTESTCDDLEVRLCTHTEDFGRVNIGVSIIELYVK